MKNRTHILKVGLLVIGIGGTGAMMSACADGYTSTSFGVGVSSYDTYRPAFGTRRDRDGDGVPNRFDRDRDGDGVPNSFDIAPSNPRWR